MSFGNRLKVEFLQTRWKRDQQVALNQLETLEIITIRDNGIVHDHQDWNLLTKIEHNQAYQQCSKHQIVTNDELQH